MKQSQKILSEISHNQRQLILNQEHATKRYYNFNRYLREKNFGQAIHYLKHFDEYLEKNRELVKIVARLITEYDEETLKELSK